MSKLGATEAAKQWGVSRQLIYKDMKRGKLSYTVNTHGQREIDVSELSRVYGEPDTNVHSDHEDTVTPVTPPVSDIATDYIETLKKQLAEKDAQLRVKDDQLAMKDEQLSQRDVQVQSLIDQLAETTHRLLPPPLEDPEEEFPDLDRKDNSKRKWWRFGRKTEDID